MPTLTITKLYADNTVLTEAQLDAMKNSIETFMNVTKIDTDNIGTLEDTVTWDNNQNTGCIDITSSGDTTPVKVLQDGVLGASEAVVKIEDTAAETSADAILHVEASNAGTTIPGVLVEYSGSGDVIHLTDGTSELLALDSSGNIDIAGDLTLSGNLDINGAGPHSIDNQLDVSGLLTCDTINATSAGGESVFTNDVDIQGTLSVTTLNPTTLQLNSGPTLSNNGGRLGIDNGIVVNNDVILDTSLSKYVSFDGNYPITTPGSEASTSRGLEIICATYNDSGGGGTISLTSHTKIGSWAATQTRQGTGSYLINFPVTFAAIPHVFVTASESSNDWVYASNLKTLTTSSVELRVKEAVASGGGGGASYIHIMVIGPKA